MTTYLSPHFTDDELRCPHCGKYRITPGLLKLVEKVRSILGDKPMIVHSAYRCSAHNAEVGGKPNSRHTKGEAMDFHVTGMPPAQIYICLTSAWQHGELAELGGIGLYDWGVHIDTAKAANGHLRQWDNRNEAKA